ncbi:class I SAM-dependent methyltransferase [Petralouisia muris]|uniref:Class I SAM-dependent methyltransferase n=1 Tax=Petralouisia muris TaxID=3032872 RepID=A0AC61RQN5_9FIRM|nr:class I SAM-dependent methyltransferase [Petralouisia muris]TGY91271.1 class I SAM-dependent methyltransferase [Petralouisia muris]
MEKEALKKIWLQEEEAAHIHGWDFSHINGKYDEERDLPWNYRETVGRYLKPDMQLLDLDTGGGEFLLSLGHPCESLAATENYPPNVALCREKLLPLGIDFRQADSGGRLPFDSGSFDMIINRHGDFNPEEISRVIKPGGIFVTEQVGAENDRELVELLLKEAPKLPFPDQYLRIAKSAFETRGFCVLEAEEAFRPIKFWDVGALVWFARIIEWEFPGFQVKECLENLYRAQEILEREGVIEGRIHRFLLAVKKRG